MTDVPRGTSVTCARPHSNLHDNDSTTIIDKKTLFGVHSQVSFFPKALAKGSCSNLPGPVFQIPPDSVDLRGLQP